MFTHLNGTLDQEVQIFGELGSKTLISKDVADTSTSVVVDETNAVLITQDEANL